MSRLSSDECQALLEVARRAISRFITENRAPDFPTDSLIHLASLNVPAGAFVTLHRGGRLRGCVGQVESTEPLMQVIANTAISAALYDSRFPPVARDEVAALKIEISVLSPLELISPEAVVVGRDGLLIVNGAKRGLLLPQVAQERQWSAQRFLEEVCAKAGLPTDAWREPSSQVFAFTAEVFSEKDFKASAK